MINKKNNFFQLSDEEKQKTPNKSEVNPENSFIKTSISASHAAQKYKLKGLKLEKK